ncbi:MAG: fumarate hydratase C-terminal domain-containing protein [Chloroflexi bacterium]|nr:fumarate hydratase C-terminal domain-containing protein [Chloroflexota bacterium]
MKNLTLPISEEDIRGLKVGDPALLSGVMLTGRDAVHKWLVDTFIEQKRTPQGDDLEVIETLKPLMAGGVIYHCGPVVSGLDTGDYSFVAAGPTTSIREEPYQAQVIKAFGLRGVIGKGGMGPATLAACQEQGAVYFHAIGGAATLIAKTVKKVLGVYKLDFGVPEAIWVLEVVDFPAVVTMDSHGGSLHDEVERRSETALAALLLKM